MIARTWHGKVRAEDSEAYYGYLLRTGIPDYRATPGNLGITVLRRTEGTETHFVLITFWESMEAIQAFAGQTPERARYYPEDERFLLEFEPLVAHHEVLLPPDSLLGRQQPELLQDR
jgi:heme-degrading monooxygenase HmoA